MPKAKSTIQQSLDALPSNKTVSSSWVRCQLGDLFKEAQYGLSVAGSSEGTYPILRMNNLQNGTLLFNDLQYVSIDEGLFEQYRLTHGDLLFNRTNAPNIVGKTSIFEAEGDFTFASYLIRLSLNRKRVSPRFFNYFMNWHETQKQLKCVSSKGVGQCNINLSNLKRLSISLPPLPEQHRIAAVLAIIDEAVANSEDSIEQIKRLKRSLLYRIFSIRKYQVDNSGEGKGTVSESSVMPLSRLVRSLKNGIYKGEEHYGKGYPNIRMFNIFEGKVNSENSPLLDVSENELAEYGLVPGDVLINRVNAINLVGKAGIVPYGLGPVTFESKNIRIRFDCGLIVPDYFAYFTQTPDYFNQIMMMVKSAIAQATINQTDLNGLSVPVRSISEQRRVVSILSAIDDRLALERVERDRLVALKKGLMQVLLTGKVRVPPGVAEEVAPAHA